MSLLTALGISYGLITSGCATPPDKPGCVEVIKDSLGWCTWTISEREIYVDNDPENKETKLDGKAWSEVKLDALIFPSQSWAAIKSYIMKNCKQHKQCAEDIGKWDRKTKKIDQKLSSGK